MEERYVLKSYVTVPQRNGESKFAFPPFGPNTYDSDVKAVIASGLTLPTGERTAFMLDAAYNVKGTDSDSEEAEFVRKNVMNNTWLWVPNINIWTPISDKNPGMYAVFDEFGKGLGKVYTIEELEDRLSMGSTEKGVKFSKDRKIRFAASNLIQDYGSKTERYHEKGTLHDEGSFIAVYDIEGSQKLDDVRNSFILKPRSRIIVNKTDKPIQSLSALGRDWVDDSRLDAYFGSDGDSRHGYVFGETGSK